MSNSNAADTWLSRTNESDDAGLPGGDSVSVLELQERLDASPDDGHRRQWDRASKQVFGQTQPLRNAHHPEDPTPEAPCEQGSRSPDNAEPEFPSIMRRELASYIRWGDGHRERESDLAPQSSETDCRPESRRRVGESIGTRYPKGLLPFVRSVIPEVAGSSPGKYRSSAAETTARVSGRSPRRSDGVGRRRRQPRRCRRAGSSICAHVRHSLSHLELHQPTGRTCGRPSPQSSPRRSRERARCPPSRSPGEGLSCCDRLKTSEDAADATLSGTGL
jgi:hypothetical protein